MIIEPVRLGKMATSVDTSAVDRFLAFLSWAVSAALQAGASINAEVNVEALTILIAKTSPKTRDAIIRAVIADAVVIFPDSNFRVWVVTLLNMELFLFSN